MKLAASDYDGTLFRNNTISQADVEGVQVWRQAGNKFGLVSGRDLGMLTPQLDHYGIGYDYAVCNNGAIICDQDGQLLFEGKIEPHILEAVSAEPCVQASFHFAYSAKDRTYLCHESEGSWIMREGRQWDFPVIYIQQEDILSLPQIHQFSLGFADPRDSAAAADTLNAKYGAYLHAYPNRCSLDITPPGISKSSGIEHLKELMHWEDASVYVIGDEVNDLPMLEAYPEHSFVVDTARDVIKAKASGVYAGVGAMLLGNL